MRIEKQADGRVELRFYDGLGAYVPVAVETLERANDPKLTTLLREIETAAEAYDNDVGAAKQNARLSQVERRKLTQAHRNLLEEVITRTLRSSMSAGERARAERTRMQHAGDATDQLAELEAAIAAADCVMNLATTYRKHLVTKTQGR